MRSSIALILLLAACSSGTEVVQEPDPTVWEVTDEKVLLGGCEDWKKRDPEADCDE